MRPVVPALLVLLAACDLGLPDTVDGYERARGEAPLTGALEAGTSPAACTPVRRAAQAEWKPVRARRAACTADALRTAVECVMMPSERNTARCQAVFSAADQTCMSCVRTKTSDAEQGPIIEDANMRTINLYGCVALYTNDTSVNGCGAKQVAYDACTDAACMDCPDPTSFYACQDEADKAACAPEMQAASCGDPYFRACSGPSELEAALNVARVFCLKQ